MGMGLCLEGATDYPRLLAWGAVMGLEGASLVQQRELLHLLGYVVPFKWRVPGSTAGSKPVSILLVMFDLYDFLSSSSTMPPWSEPRDRGGRPCRCPSMGMVREARGTSWGPP